jgi:membrane-bound lytic murein transglycosylase D
MWQFIRSTGRIYGLNGTAWVEERRDPVKATRAAARYLKRLYEITGDWYLAASSYNAGPLTLERAIQNIGTRNFWDLARSRWLRTETKNYVPELCAAILVGRNPERYGLRIVPLKPYAYETVTVSSMTSLSVLARCTGTDTNTLKELNPELLRGSTPPGTYQLRVPPGKAMDCLRQLARMPAAQRLDFQHYTVRKGDTLAKVAKRFKLTPEDLLEANDLTAKQFKAGKRLLVPPPPVVALEERDIVHLDKGRKALADLPLPSLPAVPRDLAGHGEAELPANAESSPIAVIPEPPRTAPEPKPVPKPVIESAPSKPEIRPAKAEPVPETIPQAAPDKPAVAVLLAKPGDTLAKIARAQGVSLGELLKLNPTAAKTLHPGDSIRLPGATSSPTKEVKATTTAAPRFHKVQKGDTLGAIARKYDLEPKDLKAWNKLKGDRVVLGQKLRLAHP